MNVDGDAASLEERLRRAEAALEEALAERNALWQQLNERRAAEEELQQVRAILDQTLISPSWRLTAPLRDAKAAAGRARTLGRVAAKRLRSG